MNEDKDNKEESLNIDSKEDKKNKEDKDLKLEINKLKKEKAFLEKNLSNLKEDKEKLQSLLKLQETMIDGLQETVDKLVKESVESNGSVSFNGSSYEVDFIDTAHEVHQRVRRNFLGAEALVAVLKKS